PHRRLRVCGSDRKCRQRGLWLAFSSYRSARGTLHALLNAVPTLIPRKRDGAAPCPVPITCCGWPLPQFGVPHNVHSSREQIASNEFQNSVVIPEYNGFFTMCTRLPFLISHPISHPN